MIPSVVTISPMKHVFYLSCCQKLLSVVFTAVSLNSTLLKVLLLKSPQVPVKNSVGNCKFYVLYLFFLKVCVAIMFVHIPPFPCSSPFGVILHHGLSVFYCNVIHVHLLFHWVLSVWMRFVFHTTNTFISILLLLPLS